MLKSLKSNRREAPQNAQKMVLEAKSDGTVCGKRSLFSDLKPLSGDHSIRLSSMVSGSGNFFLLRILRFIPIWIENESDRCSKASQDAQKVM